LFYWNHHAAPATQRAQKHHEESVGHEMKKKTKPKRPQPRTTQNLLCGKEGAEIDAATLASEQLINKIMKCMNTDLIKVGLRRKCPVLT